MKTIHDENKIDNVLKEFDEYFPLDFFTHNNCECWNEDNEPYCYEVQHTMIRDFIKSMREKTIHECIACVPDEQIKSKLTTYEQTWYKIDGHNICREQTITNLNNLKNNETE